MNLRVGYQNRLVTYREENNGQPTGGDVSLRAQVWTVEPPPSVVEYMDVNDVDQALLVGPDCDRRGMPVELESMHGARVIVDLTLEFDDVYRFDNAEYFSHLSVYYELDFVGVAPVTTSVQEVLIGSRALADEET